MDNFFLLKTSKAWYNSPMAEKVYRAVNLSSGRVIATRVKIAQDYKSRSVGLLSRATLEEDEGLLIKPCNSIHTFFMKFPIDAIFLDRTYRVVKIVESIPPWRLAGALFSGVMVLELSSGKIAKIGIEKGDHLTIE